jgi:hypothetical protein
VLCTASDTLACGPVAGEIGVGLKRVPDPETSVMTAHPDP